MKRALDSKDLPSSKKMLIEQKILDLYIAAQNGDQEGVIILLRHNPDIINQLSKNGFSAFNLAAENGHEEVIEELLSCKDYVNQLSSHVVSALYAAAQKGYEEVIKVLLRHDPDIINQLSSNGFSALHVSSAGGHLRVVKELLSHNLVNINQLSSNGFSALHLASEDGHPEVVKLLLTHNADINQLSKIGRSALHIASANGRQEVVEVLLRHDADINQLSEIGRSALHEAAREGHKEVVEVLLRHNADINQLSPDGYSVLHLAAENGHQGVVEALLRHNVDINQLSEIGRSALHEAAREGHKEVVEALLTHNPGNINQLSKGGYSALCMAAQNGHQGVVEVLLRHNADINQLSPDGYSVLHLAAENGHQGVVEALLTHNPGNINQLNKSGDSALYLAALRGHQGVIEALLNCDVDINQLSKSGYSALHIASANGRQEVVELLLTHNADINQLSSNGFSALHIAAKSHHKEVVEVLLKHNADINQLSKDGSSALHLAAHQGHQGVVEALLRHNADINQLSKDGSSALHLAAYQGHQGVVEALLTHNPGNKNQLNKIGSSALHLAAQNGHQGVVEALLRHNAYINQLSKDGSSALYIAAAKGHQGVVEALLTHNPGNINQLNLNGSSALHIAAQLGHKEVVEALLKHNLVNINHLDLSFNLIKGHPSSCIASQQVNKGYSALYIASQQGYKQVIETLLNHNLVNINQLSEKGYSALYIAAQLGHKEVVEALLHYNLNINQLNLNGHPALYLAATQGHKEVVEVLLRHDADINQLSENGSSALHAASAQGHKEVVEALLRHNADIKQLSSYGYSALRLAKKYGHQEVVKLLDNNRGIKIPTGSITQDNLNLRSTETQDEPDIFSNFINAIKQNDSEQLKNIVENDKKLTNSEIILFFKKLLPSLIKEGKNNNLKTILDYASFNKFITKQIVTNVEEDKDILIHAIEAVNNEAVTMILQYLDRHGYTNIILNQNEMALVYAIKKGNILIFEAILNERFKHDDSYNINEEINGSTLLHLACSVGNSSMIRFLITKGANIEAINSDNLKPFQLLPSLVEANLNVDKGIEEKKILKRKADEVEEKDNNNESSEASEIYNNAPVNLQNQLKEDIKKILELVGSKVNLNAHYNGGLSVAQYLLLAYGHNVVDLLFDQKASHSKQVIQKNKKIGKKNNKKDNAEEQNEEELNQIQLQQIGVKAKINDHIDDESNTILHFLCKQSNDKVGIIKAVINYGADINAINIHKQTALHLAILNNNIKTVLYLFKLKNIDFNIQDSANKTPLDYINDPSVSQELKKEFEYFILANKKQLDIKDLMKAFTNLEKYLEEGDASNTLRPYQKDCLQNIFTNTESIREELDNRVQTSSDAFLTNAIQYGGFVKMATGTGKTNIFLSLIKIMNLKAAIIVPTINLAEQTKARITEMFGDKIKAGIINGKVKEYGNQVSIIVYDTFDSHYAGLQLEDLLNSQLIILDEVHNSLTKKRKEIVDFFINKKDRLVVGFTATDKFSSSRKEGDLISVSELVANKFFDLSIKQGTKLKALSPVEIENIQLSRDCLTLKFSSDHVSELSNIVKEKSRGDDSVLIFVPSIKIADELAIKLNEAQEGDVIAKSVHSRTKNTKNILEDHKNQVFKYLINVDLLTVGYDDPNLKAIFDFSPTKSLVKALQKYGRITRFLEDENHQVITKKYYQLQVKDSNNLNLEDLVENEFEDYRNSLSEMEANLDEQNVSDSDITELDDAAPIEISSNKKFNLGFELSTMGADNSYLSGALGFVNNFNLIENYKEGDSTPKTMRFGGIIGESESTKHLSDNDYVAEDFYEHPNKSKKLTHETYKEGHLSVDFSFSAPVSPVHYFVQDDYSSLRHRPSFMKSLDFIMPNKLTVGWVPSSGAPNSHVMLIKDAEPNQNHEAISYSYGDVIFGLKALDAAADGLKVINEPTIVNTVMFLKDAAYLGVVLTATSGYLPVVSGADIAVQAYNGGYAQALSQVGAVAGHILLSMVPTMFGISLAPVSEALTISYVAQLSEQVSTKFSSLYSIYGTPESQLKSDLAYADFYNNLGWQDSAKRCLLDAMKIVKEDSTNKSESSVQEMASEYDLVGELCKLDPGADCCGA